MPLAKPTFAEFVERIRMFGLEYIKRYYSEYPGIVTSVDDPELRGRIRVRVPMLGLPQDRPLARFAEPRFSGIVPGENKGSFFVPDVGDSVWVSFRNGDINTPMYSSGWFATGELPSEFASTTDRGFKSSAGHVFRFRDGTGQEEVLLRHTNGTEMVIATNGNVVLSNTGGDSITIDATGRIIAAHRLGTKLDLQGTSAVLETPTGTKLDLSAASAELEGRAKLDLKGLATTIDSKAISLGVAASHPLVKGDVLASYLLQLYAWAVAHVHAAPGTPSVVPPPPPPIQRLLSLISRTR